MLVESFPAGAFGTNCYVLAAGPGERCIVVDPGMEAVEPLRDVLQRHRLAPAAVLLTHGHLDHTFSVVPVCGASGIPALISGPDRVLLTDPMRAMGPALAPLVAGLTFSEPAEVREIVDGEVVDLAGVRLEVSLAPGHTPGSVTFTVPDAGDGAGLLLSGDLLFAGSIGRSDLPGGNYPDLVASLARVVLPLDDATVVAPGHGPGTTVGRERATNPWLAEAAELAAGGDPGLGAARGRGL